MSSNLFELRNQLIAKLRRLPGFVTVGIGKQSDIPVFIVSIDSARFNGGAPDSFAGYRVLVRDLGQPVAHVFGGQAA
jgi:uncharacterized lipoprotein YmbA